MNTVGSIGVSQMQKFRELLNKFGDSLSPNYKETQVSDATVYGCIGYLADDNGVINVAVVTDDKHNVGWTILVIFMMLTAFAIICIFGMKCETKTHKPLTTKKNGKKRIVERQVYGDIADITTAGIEEAIHTTDDV